MRMPFGKVEHCREAGEIRWERQVAAWGWQEGQDGG